MSDTCLFCFKVLLVGTKLDVLKAGSNPMQTLTDLRARYKRFEPLIVGQFVVNALSTKTYVCQSSCGLWVVCCAFVCTCVRARDTSS